MPFFARRLASGAIVLSTLALSACGGAPSAGSSGSPAAAAPTPPPSAQVSDTPISPTATPSPRIAGTPRVALPNPTRAAATDAPPSAPPPPPGGPTVPPATLPPSTPAAPPLGTSAAPAGEIALVEPEGQIVLLRGPRRIALALPHDAAEGIAWSPDGHRLAFAGGVATFPDADDAAPAWAPIGGSYFRWSPDSRRLAYVLQSSSHTDDLVVSGPDGDAPQTVDGGHFGGTAPVAWAPDSAQIFAGLTLAMTSQPAAAVPPPPGDCRSGAWAPDGRRFLCLDAAGGAGAVTVSVRAWDGAAYAPLASYAVPAAEGADPTDPRWRWEQFLWLPDGSLLVSAAPERVAASAGSYRIAPDGAATLISPHRILDLHPDGSHLLVRSAAGAILVQHLDGRIIADLGPGATARWRPALLGPAPAAPLAAKSLTLSLQEPPAAGPSVEDLQQRLVALGYLAPPVDGVFGPQTAAAVRVFQTRNQLASDGIVGPQTWRALRHPDPCSAADSSERVPEAKYCPPAP